MKTGTRRCLCAATTLIAMLPAAVRAAGPDAKIPAVVKLGGVVPVPSVFQQATATKPVVVRTEADAKKLFEGDDLKSLLKKVDLKQQIVLVFGWRGSGQDKLDERVAESFPEQVFFTLTRGRTRDLREHVEIFALRSNVTWSAR